MITLLARILGERHRQHVAALLGSAAACVLVGAWLFALTQHYPFTTGLYWAVTTATTVGYGDVTPHDGIGRVISSAVMLTTIPLLAAVFALVTGGAAVAGIRRRTVPAQPIDGNGFAQLTGGIAYLRSHRLVLWLEGVLLIAMTGALGVETLLPVFAAGTWHTGSAGYGLLRMAPGIAALLAGLGLSMFSAAGQGALIIGIAFAGASAGMVAFAADPPFVLALLLLAGASLCLAVTQVIAAAMIQRAIPDALRGRISALGSAGQNGLAGLGAVATSGLAVTVGPGGAVIGLAGTIACAGIFLALLIARSSPCSSPCSSHASAAGVSPPCQFGRPARKARPRSRLARTQR